MGESEMASDLQTKSNACINSAKKMEKEEAKQSITQCFDELMKLFIINLLQQKQHN